MAYWLFKTEPGEFAMSDLEAMAPAPECWSGVRNYQARNFLRDQVAADDRVFIYHSSCQRVGIAGIARVVRAGYPDPAQFAPQSPYYDAAASPQLPRWYAVDIVYQHSFRQLVPLAVLKASPALQELALVRRGSRLSVMPVAPAQWQAIVAMADGPSAN